MKIAYTIAKGKGDTDLLLAGVADQLLASGIKTCGTVQINSSCDDDRLCDMDVRVLPDAPEIRISQSLGKEAKGCRLDPAALEVAVGLVKERLEHGADILIINKFGKHEASGQGFRDVIAKAIEMDIPVLVGVSKLNEDAFQEFTAGGAEQLSPDTTSLMSWIQQSLG